MVRHAVSTLTIVTLLVLGAALPASASCLFDDRPLADRLAEQPLVFVGTVTDLRSDGRAAAFSVEELWRGGDDDAQEIIVHGGSPGQEMVTSVDRSFSVGARYLVAARSEDGAWVSDACMPTEEWDEARHAEARPATAHTPTDDGGTPTDTGEAASSNAVLPWAVGTVLAAGAVGAYLLIRRVRVPA